MFKRLLVANRGEIACRILRTARQLGIETVAVYSEADQQAAHLELADHCYALGAAAATASYLNVERLLAIARRSGAEALHPGYGFLSERADFARQCSEAGIVFVGPPASAIAAMGDKAEAKRIMAEVGVPLLPGYHGPEQSLEQLSEQARQLGFPLLIKPVAGGGGKGMRIVQHAAMLGEALAGARREALAAFADERLLLERYLPNPRHIEVQVVCDNHGNARCLHDRDCSLQRRYQKIWEEAPALGLSPSQRQAMQTQALAAARAIDYRGVGTVEYLVQGESFFFMEMNTRLQVEHPVTEMISGVDLVAWQLQIAAGEALPETVAAVHGHAIEARLYAEDPARDFLPDSGLLQHWQLPVEQPGLVRVESGLRVGETVSPYYDPLLAKLVVWGRNRTEALRRMGQALRQTEVVGVACNVAFLRHLQQHPELQERPADTGFIERASQVLCQPPTLPSRSQRLAWCALVALQQAAPAPLGLAGWRLNAPATCQWSIQLESPAGERAQVVRLRARRQGGWRIEIEGQCFTGQVQATAEDLWLTLDGERRRARWLPGERWQTLLLDDLRWRWRLWQPEPTGEAHPTGDLCAPMHARVVACWVEPGAEVASGDALLALEAMKMEWVLRAPGAGRVLALHCQVQDRVASGQLLVDFQSEAD